MTAPYLPLPERAGGDRPSYRPLNPIADHVVEQAAALIDRSGVVEQVAAWKAQARRGPGGRPETFPLRALLVAMVVAAVLHEDGLLVSAFTEILFFRISPEMRTALGVPDPPDVLDAWGRDDIYRNVRTRFQGLLELMDPSPLPKNRRLAHDEFLAAVELRRVRHSDEEWAERHERLAWFVNALLEASIRALPREYRRRWKGSVAVDATVVPAFAKHDRRAKRTKKGTTPMIHTHSADPDADWYVRGEVDDGAGPNSAKSVWGYEATIVVSAPDDPDDRFPTLAMAMAVLHKPGHDVGHNAISALWSIKDRGHPAYYLGGDRAYSGARAETFQLPARALGYLFVFDYRIDQLGVQDSCGGLLLIEGAWYCPAIPAPLIEATRDYLDGRIDEPTYRARLVERWKYLARSKAGPDAEGHERLCCPAASPHPMAVCELKPKSAIRRGQGRLQVYVPSDLKARPPKICTQQSLTAPPEAGAKFAQALLYGSDEHSEMYATLRNCSEGFNAYVKDESKEGLGLSGRRRVRGVAAQSVFVALLLVAANLRKIAAFLAEEAAVKSGSVRRLPRRRQSRSLESWRPATSESTVDVEPHPPPV
jgi:hypothetical protein